MADDSAAPPEAPPGNGGRKGGGGNSDLAALRRILVGPEQNRLEELATELRERHVSAADMAEHLPEAIMLRGQRDRQIGRALAPTVETALRESIRRNPREIATAIFPVLGPAIRKAIAETMSALVRSINSAVEHSFSPRGIKWRIESWRTGVPYAQVVIKHALVYGVEQAFLIHAENGLLLAHATSPGLQVPDADLISGMLTAIQDFVRDSFRPDEGATLSTFTVGEHTVQVEAGPLALLALVVRGEPPESVRLKQQDALEHIHLQYAGALAEFAGETGPFQSAHALLEDCLETVVDTGGQRQGRHVWLRWAIPVAIGALALVVVAWRSNARFGRAVGALNSEPGLVVIDAQRGWGWGGRTWRISGLRDPQARTPQAVLAGTGLVPRSLSGRWESYLSLDSAVVVSRVRQAWNLPAATRLSLRGDTLTVAGDVPLSSLRLSHTDMPAGIAGVELKDTRVILPPDLDSIRASLVAERVLFAPGGFRSGRGQVLAAAARFRVLDDSVTANGGEVTLTLNGRTDPTGSNETNQALAQWRVDHVAAIFASAGVQTQRLRGEALATSRPLTARDSIEQARINRSVSFEIEVLARPRRPRGGEPR